MGKIFHLIKKELRQVLRDRNMLRVIFIVPMIQLLVLGYAITTDIKNLNILICDFDGSELYIRDDDKKETVEHRIQVYFEQTSPLIEYYRQRGLLAEINGARPIEQVTSDLLAVLGNKQE